MEHNFTIEIRRIIKQNFGDLSDEIYKQSELLQYINFKTIAANQGSKSRASFGNLYAIYVIIEGYIKQKFDETDKYVDYEGAKFSNLLKDSVSYLLEQNYKIMHLITA